MSKQETRKEVITRAIHILATIDCNLNDEALVYLGWDEHDDTSFATFKRMPSEEQVVFSFPLYTKAEQDETRPEAKHTIGEQVIPRFGSHKGKAGKIIERAWGESSSEWVYLVQFTRAKHYFYEDELR